MCVIIKRPANRIIPNDFLIEAWQKNSDGWGVGFLTEGTLIARRGMTLDELLLANDSLPPESEVIVHLRKATVGDIRREMTHPFWVRPGLALFHNGTIGRTAPLPVGKSDTWQLARCLHAILAGRGERQWADFIRTDEFSKAIKGLLGCSMAVLLDRHGALTFGRQWHRLTPQEWCAGMTGMDVSNTTAWRPRA